MFDTKIVVDLGMGIDIDGSKEVEGMEIEHDSMFGQGYEATLMMKEIMEEVLEEPFRGVRSSEVWCELYLGSQEI